MTGASSFTIYAYKYLIQHNVREILYITPGNENSSSKARASFCLSVLITKTLCGTLHRQALTSVGST